MHRYVVDRVKYLLATLLFLIAAASAVISLGPLHNLWADYRDSPVGTYLVLGLPFLALAIAAAVAGVRVLRR
jgi:hypothetical protein